MIYMAYFGLRNGGRSAIDSMSLKEQSLINIISVEMKVGIYRDGDFYEIKKMFNNFLFFD